MKLTQDLPIQRKMLVMTLLICGAVLFVAIAALFTFQVLNFRANFERDTVTLANIIANNSTATVAFKDEQAGGEVVGALQAKPSVIAATLRLPNGSIFAHYGELEETRTLTEFPPPGESRFARGQLLVSQPVKLKGEQVATLYLRSDYRRKFLELLGFYVQMVLGIMIVSTGLSLFLSSRLGSAITAPVLHLAKVAQIVGERKDYSVRAVVAARGDELGRLAESFNEMLSRIQSQDAALSLSQQKMEALIHSIDGIVWERTPDTFRYTFVSRQIEDILGYTPVQWLENPEFWVEKLFPADAAKAIQTRNEVATKAQPYTCEYRMVAADGRTVWIRESGTVLLEKDQPVAVRGIFLDVTRQKLDAEQLDKLNRQLIDTSRSAGMADVATGVLHNVGNVLNSVSVAATVVADKLRRMKIAKLGRATSMMREKNNELAGFLTQDPKGKLIPEFLSSVSEELAGEQSELINKMAAVGQHIEHIKEIVSMQQSYAKVSGVYEDLPVAGLVEDALRMNLATFDRHCIELVREFAENLPSARVDRHKVLQILINLLRNAKHAMDATTGRTKRLVVRVGLGASGRVKVTVTDNGVGIPAEHLNKIFNHGFTTKKDGHGFGLHSGANAAKEMGGSLTARSEGPGRGAEFTLELPASPEVATVQKAA